MSEKRGRPLKFETPEILQAKIEEYFKYCDDNKKYPTIAGLAYFLDVDRDTIYDYEGREDFVDTVKRARNRILAAMEEKLMNATTQITGAIFLGKNYGYHDTTELKGKLDINQNLNEEELDEKINDLLTQREQDRAKA